jgi:exosortase
MRLWVSLLVGCLIWGWLVCCLWPQWTFYETYQYGCFVPFLVVALCWKRWQRAPAPEPPEARFLTALIAVVAAVALLPARMIYEANSLWRTISWPLTLPVIVITLCWLYLMGGRAWLRHFSFPVLFLIAALPWPGSFENLVTKPLALLDTRAATEALFICGVPASQRGTTIELATDQVGVDEACSGIRSLHSALMLSLLLGELFFLRPRSRVLLIGGGVIATFLVNIGRTFALSWVCAKHGTAVMQEWHDQIGIVEVVGYMAGLLILALLLQPGRRTAVEPQTSAMRLPAPVPALLCISMAAWFVLLECGTRGWFRLRESNVTAALNWSLDLPTTAQAATSGSEAIDRAYHADETTSAHWAEPDGSLWQIFYMRWNHGSRTSQLAKSHWPEFCLGNAGLILRGEVQTRQYEVHNVKLPFRVYAFEDGGASVHVFHCIYEERSGVDSALTLDLKPNLAARIQAAWEGKRNLGQQLLEVIMRGYPDPASAEAAFKAQLEKMIKVKS